MRESTIEKNICTHARRTGWLTYKFSSPNHRGVPDRIFINPHGVTCFLEIKAPGKKPTPLQARELAILTKQGVPCAWTDSEFNGIAWLNNLREIKVPKPIT